MKKKGRDRGSPLRRQPMKARADRPNAGPRRRTKRRKPPIAKAVDARRIEAIRKQIAQVAAASRPPRWNADPEDVKRSVLKLVLTLVEFIRQLLERQAIRRMENGTLTDEETELGRPGLDAPAGNDSRPRPTVRHRPRRTQSRPGSSREADVVDLWLRLQAPGSSRSPKPEARSPKPEACSTA